MMRASRRSGDSSVSGVALRHSVLLCLCHLCLCHSIFVCVLSFPFSLLSPPSSYRLGRRYARARVERSRVACAGVYAVPARAGWGRVHVGAALQGFGRAQRQRVSGAEDAGSVGVCLPGANNVMSRTHLRQDARALSRSLERSLPLSLSLSRSLSPRSLARSRAVMDSGCRMPPP